MRFHHFSLLALLLPALAASAAGADRLRVVTSTLDMADFTRAIGGDRVEVHAITRGQYDLHQFRPRPSEVMTLRQADLVVVAGMELDAFMPALLRAARKRDLRFGGKGFVDPSTGVLALGRPTSALGGALGDVHVHGNPHFWFTPDNVATACQQIAAGLTRVDPAHAEGYAARRDAYIDSVHHTFAELRQKLAPFQGTPVLQYHPSWDYFCHTFGLEIVATIEPRPGLPPTPGHLARLSKQVRDLHIPIALVEPFYPERPLQRLQKQAPDLEVLRLPLYLGGPPAQEHYLDNLKYMVHTIHEALSNRTPP